MTPMQRKRLVTVGVAAVMALPLAALAQSRAKKAPRPQPAASAPSPAPAAAQEDRAELDRTQIIGNRELPKVLYIVPWKKPLAGDLVGRPLTSVIDEALAPVDRDVFRRQVQYDSATRPAPDAPAGPAAAPASK
jgi:hypothetical protein